MLSSTIETVTTQNIEMVYGHLPIRYRDYYQWLDDDEDNQLSYRFFTVGSCTAKVRPRDEWNTFGREIYDIKDLEQHAASVSAILQGLGLAEFFVQQTLPSGRW